MPGFDDDDLDLEDTRLPYLYEGIVVDNADPEELGRVRFTIPGLIEPTSPWALPMGTVGGGTKNQGWFAVPSRGAEVYVLFLHGDPDEPRYLAGHWGRTDSGSEVPPESRRTPPTNRVFSTDTFVLEFDETPGAERMRIRNRRTGDLIELDATDNSVTIRGTTAVSISALGLVDIQGTIVQINGRPVLPGPKPI